MSEHNQSDIVTEQLEKLSDYQLFVESVRQVNLDDSSDEKVAVLENATKLLAAVTNFLRISLIYLKKNFLRKVGETMIGKDDVMKSKEELDSAVGAFDQSVSRCAHLATLRKQQDEENEKVLCSLSNMDFATVQNDLRNKRLLGTGQWIFKESKFDGWLNGDISVLWCPGKRTFPLAQRYLNHCSCFALAGTGKTVLVWVDMVLLSTSFPSTRVESNALAGQLYWIIFAPNITMTRMGNRQQKLASPMCTVTMPVKCNKLLLN
jgi:hypothetical protein